MISIKIDTLKRSIFIDYTNNNGDKLLARYKNKNDIFYSNALPEPTIIRINSCGNLICMPLDSLAVTESMPTLYLIDFKKIE